MKIFKFLLLLFVTSSACAHSVLLKNVSVVDPDRQTVTVENITLRDGKIENVSPGIPTKFRGTVLDLSGKFLIPGLIDLHAHAWGNPGVTAEIYQEVGLEGAARRMLYAGVTSFLNLGGSEADFFSFRDKQRAGRATGATAYGAGPLFTCTKGHGTEYGIPDMARIVDSPEDAAREVKALVQKRHPDVIKIVYDHARAPRPSIDQPTMAALITAAKSYGLKTVIHIGTWTDARQAVEAGADVITHLYEGVHSDSQDGLADGDISDELANLMRLKGVSEIPTMTVEGGLLHIVNDPTILQEPLIAETVSTEVLNTYHDVDPNYWMLKWQRPSQPTYHRSIQKLALRGVPILVGTDVGNVGVFLGFSVHHEMELLVESGLSKWQALAAATTLPRAFLGQTSWLAEDAPSDFVILDGSPLEDIKNTRKIHAVIQAGAVIDRASLLKPVTQ